MMMMILKKTMLIPHTMPMLAMKGYRQHSLMIQIVMSSILILMMMSMSSATLVRAGMTKAQNKQGHITMWFANGLTTMRIKAVK